jgi:long-chain acyl-CoA synthetase
MDQGFRIQTDHLAGLYRQAAERFDSLPAFATRQRDRTWDPLSFRSLYESGRALGEALISIGVSAKEPVGLFSDNRVEWILADAAIQLCGAVNTPRGVDLTDEELAHIIVHSGMKTAFVETPQMARRCLEVMGEESSLRELIQLDSSKTPPEGVRTLKELEERGRSLLDAGSNQVDDRMAAIRSDDLFSLIYTSGTTGKPKGVMLTHANVMSQLDNIPVALSCTDRALSILPVWHIFERTLEVLTMSYGACTYYTSARHLGDDLTQVEPTFMGSAPRLWESLRHRILTKVQKAHPVRRLLFHTAYFLAIHYRDAMIILRDQDLRLKPVSPFWIYLRKAWAAIKWFLLLPWYGFFNAAVLESIRRKAGGSLKYTISGGGALPPEIDRFFNAIGIPVLEGYGLTETSPVIAVRTPEQLVQGTVGPAIGSTDLRIVDLDTQEIQYPNPEFPHDGRGRRGEIQIRGPQVMRGYFKDPDFTDEVLDPDGWFRTGDLGMITFNNTLKILGRSKATLVLSNGENVEPEPIEMRLKLSPLIADCVAVGQDAKHVGALIFPDLEGCRKAGFVADSVGQLIKDPNLHSRMHVEIREAMSNPKEFKRFEVVHEFQFLERPLEVGVELTNLFKVKRHVIDEKYASLIHKVLHPEAHHD